MPGPEGDWASDAAFPGSNLTGPPQQRCHAQQSAGGLPSWGRGRGDLVLVEPLNVLKVNLAEYDRALVRCLPKMYGSWRSKVLCGYGVLDDDESHALRKAPAVGRQCLAFGASFQQQFKAGRPRRDGRTELLPVPASSSLILLLRRNWSSWRCLHSSVQLTTIAARPSQRVSRRVLRVPVAPASGGLLHVSSRPNWCSRCCRSSCRAGSRMRYIDRPCPCHCSRQTTIFPGTDRSRCRSPCRCGP